jgi:hypothetical protein
MADARALQNALEAFASSAGHMTGAKDEANRSTLSASAPPLSFTLLEDSFDFAFKDGRAPGDQAPVRPSPTISADTPSRSIPVTESVASHQRVRERMNQAPAQSVVRISDNGRSASTGSASTGAVERTASQQPEKALVCASRPHATRRLVVALPAEDDEIVAYVAVTRGGACEQMLRRAQESAYPIVLPIKVDLTSDGKIALTVFTFSETFTYDSTASAWVGDGGSWLIGGSDLFDQRSGWTIIVRFHKGKVRSASISHNGEYKQGKLAGLPLGHY